MAIKKAIKKVEIPVYKFTLKIGDKVYEGEGNDAYAALQAVPVPESIVTECHLSLTYGALEVKKYLTVYQTKRLFYPNSMFYVAHDLQLQLK